MLARIIGFLAKATAIDVIKSIFLVAMAEVTIGKNGSFGPSKVKAPSKPASSSSLAAGPASRGFVVGIPASIFIVPS